MKTKSRAKSGGEPRRNLLEAKNELSSTEFVRGQAVRVLNDDGDAYKVTTFDCTEGNSILQWVVSLVKSRIPLVKGNF